MKTDTLITCELCGQGNIYSKALKAHQRSKHCLEARSPKLSRSEPHKAAAKKDCAGPEPIRLRAGGDAPVGAGKSLKVLTLASLDVLPPVPIGNPDAEMSAMLTAQYHKATGGMVEVLKFGAMAIEMEGALEKRQLLIPHAESKHKGSGRFAKGSGFKAWLKEFAPEITYSTAVRLKAVTESIAEEYESIVGAKVAKQFALPALVTTPAEQLPAAAQAKQLELFSFVSGTSQRSWLDRFKPAHRPGGDTSAHRGKTPRTKLTLTQAEELERTICQNAAQHLATLHKQRSFVVLKDAEMDGLINHASTVLEAVQAWRALSPRQRAEALQQHLAAMLAE